MRTLVIDTATKACSVALYDGDGVIGAAHEVIGRGHAERLLPLIAALPERGKADRIFVDVGPGSFTGIRVGVAAAKALGFAWRVPVHGYGCLAFVAAMAREQIGRSLPVDIVMTGGHGEYFCEFFAGDGHPVGPAASLAPHEALTALAAGHVAGDIDVGDDKRVWLDTLPNASKWHLISSAPAARPKPRLRPCARCKTGEGGAVTEVLEGTAADVSSIMPIMEDAFDPAFGEAWNASQCLSALALPQSRLLLAKSNGQILGFALTRWVLDDEELLMIGVARSMQRQAIGSRLLGEVIHRAKQEGRTQLFLEVRDGNAAHLFYINSGFRPSGDVSNIIKLQMATGLMPLR